MAKPLVEIQGYDKFLKAIEKLPDKTKRSEMLKLIRKTTKPTILAAKANINDQSGRLARSIGNITGKSKTYPNILVGPRIKGNHAGFHGHLVEFGTKKHVIWQKYKTKNGRIIRRRIEHPGSKPHPFMKPAFESTKGLVSKDLEVRIAKYLEKKVQTLLK